LGIRLAVIEKGMTLNDVISGLAQRVGTDVVVAPDAQNLQRHTQDFEMFSNRALYHDGWIASVRHGRLPWENIGSYDFAKDVWELYKLDGDFSEANDLAATNPEKLKELQDLFLAEARKYNVLPLDDRFIERGDTRLRPSLIEGRTKFTYLSGTAHVAESSAANTFNTSHTITATVEVPKTGGDGVLVARGGFAGGYSLYVKDGKPAYEYNWFGEARYRVRSSQKLSPGAATIRVEFKYDGGGVAKGGMATLFVNDKKVGEGRIDKTEPVRFSANETFDTGLDSASPVSTEYQPPFRYTGTLKKVDIDVAQAQLGANDLQKLRALALMARLGVE